MRKGSFADAKTLSKQNKKLRGSRTKKAAMTCMFETDPLMKKCLISMLGMCCEQKPIFFAAHRSHGAIYVD
jgi:hypothetical protein